MEMIISKIIQFLRYSITESNSTTGLMLAWPRILGPVGISKLKLDESKMIITELVMG